MIHLLLLLLPNINLLNHLITDSEFYYVTVNPSKPSIYHDNNCHYLNMFNGIVRKHKEFDTFDKKAKSSVDIVLEYLENIICNSNKISFDYLIQ